MIDEPIGHFNTVVDYIMDEPISYVNNAVDCIMDEPISYDNTKCRVRSFHISAFQMLDQVRTI
jgi:hypothetical protein